MSKSLHQETNDELMKLRIALEQSQINQLTKREEIAAMVLQSLIAKGGGFNPYAEAVKRADYLLEELNK